MAARGFLGSGDLYINRIVGGVKQGQEGPFECEQFEIKANSELRERVSKSRNGYGQVVASAAMPQPFDLSVTLGEADATLVYRTDALAAKGAVRLVPLPEAPVLTGAWMAAVLRATTQRPLAEAFVAHLVSAPGRAVLQRHGFDVEAAP